MPLTNKMRIETWTKLSSGLIHKVPVARRTPWICPTCHKHSPKRATQLFVSRRFLTTKTRPPTQRLPPALQGLADIQSQETPAKAPKIRMLAHVEKRAIQRLDILLEDSQAILHKDAIPTEEEILDSLKTCNGLAQYFKAIQEQPALTTVKPGGEAGNLLFLDSFGDGKTAKQELSPTTIGNMAASIAEDAMEMISVAVNKIAKDEKVFITPNVLHHIVSILSLLGHPQSLAQIFILYAEKPAPIAGSNPIQYTPASPNKITAAVPLKTAELALDAGIKSQNLPLCLDITEQTVQRTAYRRSKIAQKALFPAVAASLTPAAAYVIASQFAEMQVAMSSGMMTLVGTLGIATYMGVLGTMGFITVTTANDQMERVTWAPGTHMRQRWVREDERAFMDKIACAWGFQDRRRRGDEEGPDWQALKELCSIRGMILDRVELMDGMQ